MIVEELIEELQRMAPTAFVTVRYPVGWGDEWQDDTPIAVTYDLGEVMIDLAVVLPDVGPVE